MRSIPRLLIIRLLITRRPATQLLVPALCLMLGACAADPIDNPGTWKAPPTGLTSNDQNLRAMLVNPHDFAIGRGDSTSVGVTAATAARKELAGTRAPLLNAGASSAAQGGGAGGAAPPQAASPPAKGE